MGGGKIKDLAKPDVRTLVDATQGGANQHILLTMYPARPSLADALRITDCLAKTGRLEMGRHVCPTTRRETGIGTWPSLDHGSQWSFLR